ncbi:MAG: type II toxin-antitoxin system ParD family antitoxin [Deltaproteobacteria bacterium]|nr:type II toxin-antitoxin system ParD family antitoxin [Deltaproteobacteria bacterium]
MGTMNISLPESLKAFVDERVASGRYGTSSEYVRELIRKDQARQHLRGLLVEGLESPTSGPADESFWAAKRKALGKALALRRRT